MYIQEAFEEYLLDKMMTLCADGRQSHDIARDANRVAEDLGLFDAVTPFARFVDTLGPGMVGVPRVIEDAPQSLRVSAEHRYTLERWPLFEFVVFESEDGLAWGQTFARRVGTPVPTISEITDLARWSHVESEVRAALGAPVAHEGWPPWEISIYRVGETEATLCYVYGLLQSVTTARSAAT